MVNAVCKSSRLIGCYHHHPHVIPLPSTTSLQLTEDDEFLVIANTPFWACISHKEAVTQVRNIADSKIAASKLRDLALAHGSKEEISIIVVRFLNSHFVPQYRKIATSGHSDVRTSRPITIHGESGLHYSTASLGRIKHREPLDAENPLQKRTKSIYSVTTQPQPHQPKVIAPTLGHHDDTGGNENSQVVMRKTVSESSTTQDNERHQKALSASPVPIPTFTNEQSEHKKTHASHTNHIDTSKGSSRETKAVTKKKTELINKAGGWETKDTNKDSHKKASSTLPDQILSTRSNQPVSQPKQQYIRANPTTNTAKGSSEVMRKKTTELTNKIGGWETKDHHKKTSSPRPNKIPSNKNEQVTQPQPKTAHVNSTYPLKDKSVEVDVTKKTKSQPKNEVQQHNTDHVIGHHKKVKSASPDTAPPAVQSQHKPVHTTTTSYDDHLVPTKSPDSHDEQSSFNALRHSSSDSLADYSLLNQSMDATWFESMPPLQLDEGFDTFGLELGMLSDNSNEVTDNVVFGGQKDWEAKIHSNKQPAPSVMDTELEEAKSNFNFDELIAGLNNTWMTTLQSLPNTTSNTTPSTSSVTTARSPLKRDDSILSASLMAQFEQPSVENDEELDNLMSQLNEFVDDPY